MIRTDGFFDIGSIDETQPLTEPSYSGRRWPSWIYDSTLSPAVSAILNTMPDEEEREEIQRDIMGNLTAGQSAVEVSAKAIFHNIFKTPDVFLANVPHIPNARETSKILRVLDHLSDEDKNWLMVSAAPMLKHVKGSGQIIAMLEAILAIPAENRKQVISDAMPILKDVKNDYQIIAILEMLLVLPVENIAESLADIMPILKEITDYYIKNSVMRKLKIITIFPAEKRAKFIKDAMPLLKSKEIRIPSLTGPFLSVLTVIPEESLKDVIAATIQILKIHGYYAFFSSGCTLMETIYRIPAEKRAEVIKTAMPILKEITDDYWKAKILSAVYEKPEENWKDVIAATKSILKIHRNHMINRCATRACYEHAIVTTIIAIPAEKRAKVIAAAMPILKEIADNYSKTKILSALNETPEENWAEVIPAAVTTLKGISSYSDRALIIKAFIKSNGKDWIKAIAVITTILKRHDDFIGATGIRYLCWLRLETLENIALSPDYDFKKDLPKELAAQLPLLSEQGGNTDNIKGIVRFLIINKDVFELHDEHPVLQEAITYQISLENLTETRNPYVVFQKHVENRTETSSFEPKAQDVEGQSVKFQLEKFREMSVSTVSRKDLPEAVNPDSWENLIDSFTTRMDGLSRSDQEKVHKEITLTAGDLDLKPKEELDFEHRSEEFRHETLNKIKVSCWDSTFLEGLLSEDRDPVPFLEAQFTSIVHFILDRPSDIEEGKLLSPQEEAFIKMSTGIMFCPGGKAEGITKTYFVLPQEYKHSQLSNIVPGKMSSKMDSIIRGTLLVQTALEQQLSNQFSEGGDIMKELTGEDQPRQGVHQRLYLENSIAHIVGLPHSLKFDLHTRMLFDELVKRPVPELLSAFYKHFTPEYCVDKLMTAINEALKEALKEAPKEEPKEELKQEEHKTLHGDLCALLPKDRDAEFWDVDEDTYAFSMNKKGAMELLLALGYLQKAD